MMSELKRSLLLGALAILGLAYWLNTPIPDGFSTEAQLVIRKEHAALKLQLLLTWIVEQLGIESQMTVLRYWREFRLPKSSLSDDDIQVDDAVFDSVPVRVYRPKSMVSQPRPGIVYYHGGGWVLQTVDTNHAVVMKLAKRTNAVIVSVEYRLAPKHIYPAAHEDCVLATKYFIQRANEYNVDSHRIAIYGESAGGNLAATVALRLRDEDFQPSPKVQVLIYPIVQSIDFHLPSMISNSGGPILTQRDWVVFPSMYLTGNSTYSTTFRNNQHISPVARQKISEYVDIGRLPPKYLVNYKRPVYEYSANEQLWNEIKDRILHRYMSPLVAPDLGRLPMAYIMTCEYDILRDEGILYAIRLRDAGNDVTHVNWDNGFHAVFSMGLALDWPEVDKMIDHVVNFLKEKL